MSVERLLDILRVRRPHDSNGEKTFVNKFLKEAYPQHTVMGPMENIVIVVLGDPQTMFSCHTDTVHRLDGEQELHIIMDKIMADDDILGADDGAGIYIMLEMIDAKVPGTYIFHRGEERGGIGSRWIRDNEAEWLKKFKRAIAFDRKGVSSVITHQMGGRCCSEVFATTLSDQLGKITGIMWEPDPTGSFTDTAQYVEHIQECTNLSTGYYKQHSKDEYCALAFTLNMATACSLVKWSELPSRRVAEQYVIPTLSRFSSRDIWGDDFSNYNKQKTKPAVFVPDEYKTYTVDDITSLSTRALRKLCAKDPLWAAELLIDFASQLQDPVDVGGIVETDMAYIDGELDSHDERIADLTLRMERLERELSSTLVGDVPIY